MRDVTNEDRSDWAAQACMEFASITGQSLEDELPDIIGDLIANLLHLADSSGLCAETFWLRGKDHFDYEAPYTYVVTADCYDMAVEYALHAHGPRFGLRLESVEPGVPSADCGYHWNDRRPEWRKSEVTNES